MRLVIFGVSNMIGDVFDCAFALGLTPSLVVRNCAEVIRPRTKSINERIRLLQSPPEIISMDEFTPQEGECYFLGTTSPQRGRLVEDIKARYGITCCTLVHPTAYVSPLSRLGDGVFIGAGSVIGPGTKIGDHVFINRKVSIGHDTVVEPFARLQPGCNVGGHVHIGMNTTIGIGANVIEELVIGKAAYVAAGAAVIEDVADHTLVVGVPARFKKNLL